MNAIVGEHELRRRIREEVARVEQRLSDSAPRRDRRLRSELEDLRVRLADLDGDLDRASTAYSIEAAETIAAALSNLARRRRFLEVLTGGVHIRLGEEGEYGSLGSFLVRQ